VKRSNRYSRKPKKADLEQVENPVEQSAPDKLMVTIYCNRCGRTDRVDITKAFNLARRCPGYETSHIRIKRVAPDISPHNAAHPE